VEQSICIFGASTTQGFYDPKQGGWADRLKSYLYLLALKTKDYYEVFNLGVSGNTSRDLLKRFYNEAKERNPSIIIVSLGDNDAGLKIPLEEYELNMDKILIQAQKFTREIILLGGTNVNEKFTNPVPWNKEVFYKNEEIKKYDLKLKSLAERYGLIFDPLSKTLNNNELQDGIHPNSKGHKRIFENVKRILVRNKLISKL
jgi:lysophospholipase L1-like esterase